MSSTRTLRLKKMSKIKNYMMDIHEFLNIHYRTYSDLDRVISLLKKEYSLDNATAIAHIRRFDEEMQTVRVEP